MKRFGKHLAYGVLFLVLWGVVGFGVYYSWLRPVPTCFDNLQNQEETGVDCGGTCIRCELKGLEFEESHVTKIPVGNKQISLLAEVKNPSASYGAMFHYELSIRGAFGGEIDTIQGDSSLGPREARVIAVAGLAVDPRDVGEVTLEVTEFSWDTDNTLPSHGLLVDDVTTLLEGERIKVNGRIANDGSVFVRRVRLTGLVFDREGGILNVSVVELSNIDAFDDRGFTIFFPEIESVETRLDATKTQILWEVVAP